MSIFTLQNAEFVWSKGFQSLLLSVYYIGSFVSLIPGGWMANRFGGKRLVTIPMLVSAAFTLLTPVLIRWNPYIILVVRLLMGICSVSIHKSNQASRLYKLGPDALAVCRAHKGLPDGFLLLRYSVLFTVESLSLLYLLVIS